MNGVVPSSYLVIKDRIAAGLDSGGCSLLVAAGARLSIKSSSEYFCEECGLLFSNYSYMLNQVLLLHVGTNIRGRERIP